MLAGSEKYVAMSISKVIDEAGLSRVAKACGRAPSTVHKWKARNRLPRTEWTGETRYAETIAALHGGVTAEELRRWPGAPEP